MIVRAEGTDCAITPPNTFLDAVAEALETSGAASDMWEATEAALSYASEAAEDAPSDTSETAEATLFDASETIDLGSDRDSESWDTTDDALEDALEITEPGLDATDSIEEPAALPCALAALKRLAAFGPRLASAGIGTSATRELAADEMLSSTGVSRPITASETLVAAFSPSPGSGPTTDSEATETTL